VYCFIFSFFAFLLLSLSGKFNQFCAIVREQKNPKEIIEEASKKKNTLLQLMCWLLEK
jgi:hypothetical protein